MTFGGQYHHGDLARTLRQTAVEVIEERGVRGFSMREVARRAGVSHSAPAHHFRDVNGLLTSIAAEGFSELERVLAAAAEAHDDPVEQLAAIGEAYVELARAHRAHCAVMFGPDAVHPCDGAIEGSRGAYDAVAGVVRRLVERRRAPVDVDTATRLCWSSIQGLIELETKLAEMDRARGLEPMQTRQLVRDFTRIIVDGFASPRA